MEQALPAAEVPSLWEVIARSRRGEKMDEKTFDMSIFRTAERLKRKYDIRYDPEHPVPSDDQMADRVFAAELEFYLENSTYCLDTGRVIKFTREEVESALADVPSEVELGEGDGVFRMVHRDVEGLQEPIVFGGIQTTIFSDDEIMGAG